MSQGLGRRGLCQGPRAGSARKLILLSSGVLALGALASGVVTQSASAASASPSQALTSAQAKALSRNVSDKVIVTFRQQSTPTKAGSAGELARERVQASEQSSVLSELRATGAKNVKSYKLVNAVAATVSAGEAARLAANPAVAQVSGDVIIHGPTPTPVDSSPASGAARTVPPGVCTPGKPQLDPQALQITHTQSQDPSVPTARSLGFTGAGVKVAYMAEGIDIDNPNFIRPDGSHVFVDYQDFSGDGTDAPTSGDEAFLDASAIAAQGTVVYNLKNFSAVPIDENCPITIVGESPGVDLVGLKVFGENNATTESGFLEAIDYAVTVDHVNVLNESFGSNPYPDVTSLDATKQFNDAAVAAGTTVTVSTGDAGPTSTIGSPSDDPLVISSGASTTYRFYAQSGYAAYQAPFATDGYVDDQISPLSSSGFAQDGTTVDEVAPGDINVASCTPSPMYFGCTNFAGKPSSVEESGGTSESAPTVAGVAALVMQAYGKTHGGAVPTPALVKQIITSTGDDLNAPAEQQGTGRLNAYRAVLAAESVSTTDGSPAPQGSSLLLGKSQINKVGAPGSTVIVQDTITNTGIGTDTIALGDRVLGTPTTLKTGSVDLTTSAPHFTDFAGAETDYRTLTFKVPTGLDRLKADIVYPGNPALGNNNRVRLILIDPLGRYAAHSLPQGVGNAGDVQVARPAAGVWTALIYSRVPTVNGLTGIVRFRAVGENYVSTGTMSPSSLTLAPGQTKAFTVGLTIPTTPGDSAVAVTMADGDQRFTLPVTLRSEVVPGTRAATFSGDDTGPNGRPGGEGFGVWYQFEVPKGTSDITANIALANNPKDTLYAYLVDPEGQAVGYSSNSTVTTVQSARSVKIKPSLTTSVYARDPEPGQWRLLLNFASITGTQLDQAFSGDVELNAVKASASLPTKGTKLAAGQAVTIPVKIKNTGVAPEDYFLDARLDSSQQIPVTLLQGATDPLPLRPSSPTPAWLTPTETSTVNVAMQASLPVTFDYGSFFGDPDLVANSSGNSATASFSANPVVQGLWFAEPSEIGPYGTGPAPSGNVATQVSLVAKGFDQTVTNPLGDLWLGAVDPTAGVGVLTVQPGQTLTIPVTFTPQGPAGSRVSGTLYVDDLSEVTGSGLAPNGSELIGLPYSYTVK